MFLNYLSTIFKTDFRCLSLVLAVVISSTVEYSNAQSIDFSLSSYNIVIAENKQSSFLTSQEISVFLNTMPSSTVTVNFEQSVFDQYTITPTTLTFGSSNWNIPQIVTIEAINDLIIDDNPHVSVVNVTSSITIHDSRA